MTRIGKRAARLAPRGAVAVAVGAVVVTPAGPAGAVGLAVSVPTPPVSAPSVTVRGVSTPNVTVPRVSTPNVTVPGVSTPSVTVPGVSTPAVHTPSGTVPGVRTPSVTVPGVRTPAVTVPGVHTPSVTVPGVRTPSVSVPGVRTARGTVPHVAVPGASGGGGLQTGGGGSGSSTPGGAGASAGGGRPGLAAGGKRAAGHRRGAAERSSRAAGRRRVARERGLHRLVSSLHACLAVLPGPERRVLILRAGVGGRARSRAAVGRRLGLTPAQVARVERAGLRRLRALVGAGRCGAGTSLAAWSGAAARALAAAAVLVANPFASAAGPGSDPGARRAIGLASAASPASLKLGSGRLPTVAAPRRDATGRSAAALPFALAGAVLGVLAALAARAVWRGRRRPRAAR